MAYVLIVGAGKMTFYTLEKSRQYPFFNWVFAVDLLLKYQAISKTIFTLSLSFKRISSGFETHCNSQKARMLHSACQVWKLSTRGENKKWVRLVGKSWTTGERGWGPCGDTDRSATCYLTKAPQKLLSSQPDSGDSIHLFCFFGVFLSGEQELLLGMILSYCCNYTTFSSTTPVLPKRGWRSRSFFLACTEKNKVK